jgi:beta-lactamase regulating signal transducer with metallopeptidase domain
MNWLGRPFPMVAVLLSCTTKITIALALSWITTGALRRLSAAQRHRVWTAGILGSLILPLFSMLTPVRYSVAIVSTIGGTAAHWVPKTAALLGSLSNASPFAIVNHVRSNALYGSVTILAILIWAIGSFLVTVRLLAGLIQVTRVSARSKLLEDADWVRLVTGMSNSLDVLRPVRIFQCSNRNAMPMTWGVFRPRIILPPRATEWSEERRRIVLAHELAHIGRQDWFLQICAELLRCFYWFHPLAWVAVARIRQESEQACDDVVLNYGIPAPGYANELLAQTLETSDRNWPTALAIARPSSLERRFTAMLTEPRNRNPLSKKSKLATTLVAMCLLLPLVALRVPAQIQSGKSASAPQGWILAGSNPASYQTGIDHQASDKGFSSAYLRSKQSAGEGFGTLMQEFSAAQYAGKRLRLSASVKADQLSDWAGLWMRVDKGSESVAFDNMTDRPIKGTTGWQNYEVVLDVPQDATGIAFGVLLSKQGNVWLNDVKFQSVGLNVPTTGKTTTTLREGPINLNFEN